MLGNIESAVGRTTGSSGSANCAPCARTCAVCRSIESNELARRRRLGECTSACGLSLSVSDTAQGSRSPHEPASLLGAVGGPAPQLVLHVRLVASLREHGAAAAAQSGLRVQMSQPSVPMLVRGRHKVLREDHLGLVHALLVNLVRVQQMREHAVQVDALDHGDEAHEDQYHYDAEKGEACERCDDTIRDEQSHEYEAV
eukprot:3936591-Rhodomonas_salina.3